MKKQTVKRALFASAMSLLLCVSMLVGATFAWFTDAVTSGNNIIKSGNLDIELYYQVEGQSDWTKVTATSNIFMENARWEPGHTEVVKLKVVNEGSLALKYNLGVNIASETGSVNAEGNPFKLSEFIKFGIVEGAQTYNREQAVAAVDATATALKTAYNSSVKELLPKTDDNTAEDVYTDIVTMVVYMPTSVGNMANHAKDAEAPTINLGLNLFATQMTYEDDSFNNMYDEDAIMVTSDAELTAALATIEDGDTIYLAGASFGAFDLSALRNKTDVTIVGIAGAKVAGTYRSKTNDVVTTNLTFKGITFTAKVSTESCKVNGITVDGCKFVDGAWLLLTGYGSGALDGATVQNCVFENTTAKALSVQNASKNVVIKNNTFTNCGTNAIHADTVSGDYLVEGNVINGTGDRAIRFGTKTGANITIKDNVITNGFDSDGEVVRITGDVIAATASGNTHNGNAITFINDGAANVGREEGAVVVDSDAELTAALATIEDGDTIYLAGASFGAFDLSALENKNDITVVGVAGAKVAGTYRSYTHDVPTANLTFKNITFTAKVSTENCKVNGITVDGCKFVDGAWLLLTGYGSGVLDGATVQNCVFENTTAKALSVQNASKNVVIKNNTFTNCGTNAIHADTVSGDYLIEGNVINGTGDRAIRFGTKTGANITIKDNVITNGFDSDGEVVKITGDVIAVTASGNTHNGNAITFAVVDNANVGK